MHFIDICYAGKQKQGHKATSQIHRQGIRCVRRNGFGLIV